MSLQESWLDTESPTSDLLISIFGWIAQQERLRIQERIHAGLDRARRDGKRFGRPRIAIDMEKALTLKKQGLSLRQIAQQLGLKRPTLHRALLSLSQNGDGNQR